ncbi:MAG: LacI family DNA-binding transcriptional regulator [Mangrovibacterium sp.]
MSRVSLKDVAKKVGVSIALVSYVVNGKEANRVTPELAEKIRDAVRELNYQPNDIARSLKRGSSKTIGLIVSDVSVPFFGKMARIIQDEAEKYGYTMIFGNSDEKLTKFNPLIDIFLNRKVDGFIIVPIDNSKDKLNAILENRIPLVLIDRSVPGVNASHVVLDNFKATYDATNYLISQGCEKISMVAYKTSLSNMQDRIKGYSEAMKEAGLESNIHLAEIEYQSSFAEIEISLSRLIQESENPEAIIFLSSTLSIHGLNYVNKNNIRIPEDMYFFGFDGGYFFDLFQTPMAYIQQPLEEICREAVKLLVDLLTGSDKISHVKLNPKLFINKMSGPGARID